MWVDIYKMKSMVNDINKFRDKPMKNIKRRKESLGRKILRKIFTQSQNNNQQHEDLDSPTKRPLVCPTPFTIPKILAKGRQLDAIDFNPNLTSREKLRQSKALFKGDRCIQSELEHDYKGDIEREDAREKQLARIQ